MQQQQHVMNILTTLHASLVVECDIFWEEGERVIIHIVCDGW